MAIKFNTNVINLIKIRRIYGVGIDSYYFFSHGLAFTSTESSIRSAFLSHPFFHNSICVLFRRERMNWIHPIQSNRAHSWLKKKKLHPHHHHPQSRSFDCLPSCPTESIESIIGSNRINTTTFFIQVKEDSFT